MPAVAVVLVVGRYYNSGAMGIRNKFRLSPTFFDP